MNNQAKVCAVAGLRGYGKTTHILQMTRGTNRVLYYDTLNDDYTEGIVFRDLAKLKRFWRNVYQGPFRLTYKPVDPLADITRICELVYECGNMTLVIDEVQLYFRGPWCDPALTKVITAGRHAGIELIGATQAPKKLGELFRSQAHTWDVFAIREPDHAKYIADRCPGVSVNVILTLAKFQYVHFVDGADQYWICMDDLGNGVTNKAGVPFERPAKEIPSGPNPSDDNSTSAAVGDQSADSN